MTPDEALIREEAAHAATKQELHRSSVLIAKVSLTLLRSDISAKDAIWEIATLLGDWADATTPYLKTLQLEKGTGDDTVH